MVGMGMEEDGVAEEEVDLGVAVEGFVGPLEGEGVTEGVGKTGGNLMHFLAQVRMEFCMGRKY